MIAIVDAIYKMVVCVFGYCRNVIALPQTTTQGRMVNFVSDEDTPQRRVKSIFEAMDLVS